MAKQYTIQAPITFSGIGVHTGAAARITLEPAPAGTGIVFVNEGSPGQRIRVGDIVPEAAMHATVLRAQGWFVSTVEHLLAALWVLGVTNVEVVVQGHEVPILDGSALLFCHELGQTGLLAQEADAPVVVPKGSVIIADERGRRLALEPAEDGLSVAYTADFRTPVAGNPSLVVSLTRAQFERDIAPARTFGSLDQLPMLRRHNLAQGTSLGNTLVLGDGLVNQMRLEDECVRHKVLDLVGDMALMGVGLAARVTAAKTGHDFNRLLVKHYKEHPEDWHRL